MITVVTFIRVFILGNLVNMMMVVAGWRTGVREIMQDCGGQIASANHNNPEYIEIHWQKTVWWKSRMYTYAI